MAERLYHMPVRVVVDSNVLISALLFPGGPPEAVYRLALEGRVQLVTSRPLLAELGRVLVAKFGWDTAHADEAVAQLARVAELVAPSERVQEIVQDPADDRVLEAAVAGEVEVIVSGDRHLLDLQSWRSIAIERPADFLRKHNRI